MSHRPDIRWRCRRGTRELDLLLQNWLNEGFDGSSPAEQQIFTELLQWQDDELSRLLFGQSNSDDERVNELAGKIRALSLSRS